MRHTKSKKRTGSDKMSIQNFFRIARANKLAAIVCALVIIGVGLWLVRSQAAGFFAAVESDAGTLSGNAQVVSDASASGGKAIQFTAPVTPPPPGPSPRPFPFPAGMKPDATNTGLLVAASQLTIVSGDQTYGPSFNGQTITGKDFKGFVTVTGANITFTNCKFEGKATSSNHALLDTEDSTGTITVQDSEFVPSNPSATIDGLWTRNANLYRINVHGSVDGMKGDSNTLVQDSYIHDMKWFASDPNQGGGETHNDGVQTFAGEVNVTLRHNNIDLSGVKDSNGNPASNAAWQASANNSLADSNWFDGGGCTLNFAHHDTPLVNTVTNNRFGRHQFFTGCAILLSTQSSLKQNSGNVWDDAGTSIPPPQQHD
jgi:hypothetical protein